jgi:hypothetical protein
LRFIDVVGRKAARIVGCAGHVAAGVISKMSGEIDAAGMPSRFGDGGGGVKTPDVEALDDCDGSRKLGVGSAKVSSEGESGRCTGGVERELGGMRRCWLRRGVDERGPAVSPSGARAEGRHDCSRPAVEWIMSPAWS